MTVHGQKTVLYLVAIFQENVVEGVEVEGVAVGERAVHIEEDCLDCAEVRERSLFRVSAHSDASNFDGLCGKSIARHLDCFYPTQCTCLYYALRRALHE